MTQLEKDIFGGTPLPSLALEVFHFQYEHNPLYRSWVDTLGVPPDTVQSLSQIPFLPVSFFKSGEVRTTDFVPAAVFESSGTTGTGGSRHEVKDLELYKESFIRCFRLFYGLPGDYCIIGLLPAYLERSNSSLVVMVHELIGLSGHPDSGFYLYEHERLQGLLTELEKKGQKTLLIGVTFALLDFAEKYALHLQHTIVMETGGMKGRRKEITRPELHAFLQRRLGVKTVHAEYGMTELLSQAYSAGEGRFRCPPWMKVLVRKEDDPLDVTDRGEGLLNIIDLANIYSCSFIAVDDIGRIHADGSFEVSGRVDNSDIRGCSLMVV
ncbi:acyl transferase [Flavitalea sp. BT771]|uniref:acyl transferase n=1 Tax=Flavitalea sp. BT771 TaxID=3063329 RepID=UPI0026E31446|nr:acyl transferase [Flavitalea sp. BT771]MDO6431342.1 acyl transferase [Flavitalea sp. BT771]MDV6220250.1 acyl transferase [Flavitalea sp. BT771]